MRRIVPVLLLVCSACSEEELEPGRALLDPGHETDPWSEQPAPTRATVEKESSGGAIATLIDGPAPLDEFSLGKGGVGSFIVSGLDDAGTVHVRARSLPVSPAGLAATTLPLFVSRTGRFARPPGELSSQQGQRPPSAIVAGRYVLLAGGQDGDRIVLDGYDLGAWAPLQPPPTLGCPSAPCRVCSLAVVAGSLALAIGDDWAIWFDLTNGTSGDVSRPAGLASWSDVAGGATVTAPDGSAYVLGGTRPDNATSWVVRVSPEGDLSALALAAPRDGAAATWVLGRGLLVGAGSDTAAGAELLIEGALAFSTLPFPPDPTRGAALVALDSGRAVRVGGRDGTGTSAAVVELNLACGAGCQPTATGASVDLQLAQAFPLGNGRFLTVGADPAGETSAVVVDGASTEARPLKDARHGGTALALPTGHVGIAGGVRLDDTTVGTFELYVE